MKFSIITPSFNQLPYLKRCIASVADQCGVEVEHLVMDGGSTDGTVEFLREYRSKVEGRKSNIGGDIALNNSTTGSYQLNFVSEADKGMYDALNKGFDLALNRTGNSLKPLKSLKTCDLENDKVLGHEFNDLNERSDSTISTRDDEIIAWLNCDEQYLEGTLKFVADWFSVRPETELLCGGALLIRPDGSLLAFRKPMPLRWSFIAAAHLYNLSCGMFFRRTLWQRGIRFDTSFRNLGDQDWVMRLLQAGIRTGCTARLLSTFCFTGQNLSQNEQAVLEEQRLRAEHPFVQRLRVPLNGLRWTEKLLRGAYHQNPFDYAVYPREEADHREQFLVQKASSKWPEAQPGRIK